MDIPTHRNSRKQLPQGSVRTIDVYRLREEPLGVGSQTSYSRQGAWTIIPESMRKAGLAIFAKLKIGINYYCKYEKKKKN